MDSFLHNIYEVCVDGLHFTEWKHFLCIFIRFSSGMQRKAGGESREKGGRGKNKCARARVGKHETENSSLRVTKIVFQWLCVFRAHVRVAPMYPQASLVALPTDVKQKSYANSRSFYQRPFSIPYQLFSPTFLSFPMITRKLFTISALDPPVIPSKHPDMAF